MRAYGGPLIPNSILAVRLGPWQELANGAIDTGTRCVLSVRIVHMEIQSTTFLGDTLFQMTASPWGQGVVDIGSLDSVTLFRNFLNQFKNKVRGWAQLDAAPPNPSLWTYGGSVINLPLPDPPVSEAPLMMIDCGYDTLKGWWIQFKGNFRINIHIFQDFPLINGGPPDYQIKVK